MLPSLVFQQFGFQTDVQRGIGSEEKTDVAVVPTVQFLRLREIGVAPQRDPAEAGATAERGGPVEVGGRAFMAGTVGAAIEDLQQLAAVGQRDQQRMVSPFAVVADVDALLALAGRFHD